ncbi:MAG: hypothetical protein WBD28_01095 [Candidatus Zixiibacteriota bacterium]
MDPVPYILLIVNLIIGFGLAVPLARLLRKVNSNTARVFRYFVTLIGIYFIEGIAITVGMGIPVLSVGLAFVWGIVFGLWLREQAPARQVIKTSFSLSLYSCLPAASFIIIPVLAAIGGRNVLSAEQAIQFGIPEFLHLPFPLNTILGFYVALVIGAVVFKTVITTGEVSLLIHLGEKSKGSRS